MLFITWLSGILDSNWSVVMFQSKTHRSGTDISFHWDKLAASDGIQFGFHNVSFLSHFTCVCVCVQTKNVTKRRNATSKLHWSYTSITMNMCCRWRPLRCITSFTTARVSQRYWEPCRPFTRKWCSYCESPSYILPRYVKSLKKIMKTALTVFFMWFECSYLILHFYSSVM